MNTIVCEADKKIQSNKNHFNQIECSIKSKYKQTHELFGEIEKLRKDKK